MCKDVKKTANIREYIYDVVDIRRQGSSYDGVFWYYPISNKFNVLCCHYVTL